MNAILTWLATTILDWLAKRLASEIGMANDKIELDRQRGETNAANVKAYDEAADRAKKILAAQLLLNGTRPNP
jgi:hypothetical protein